MSDFEIHSRSVDGLPQAAEIDVRGKVSSMTAPKFIAAVDAALARRASVLILGMKDVNSLASVALSYLANLFGRLEQRGGAIFLVQCDPKVKIVLSSLGLVQFFQFFPDADAARAEARQHVDAVRRKPRLLVLSGPDQGLEFPVGGAPLTVGTDPEATIRVGIPKVDPRHCEVHQAGDRILVKDLGSKAGTFVGRRKIAEEPLQPGDVIRLMEFELRFLAPGETAPAP